MSLADELQWQERKAVVKANIDSFLSAGISLDAARSAAGWNITLEYDNFADLTVFPPPLITPTPPGLRDSVKLFVSRSQDRVNPGILDSGVLDVGKFYAVFINDVPELGITEIQFSFDTAFHHTEFSTPWDYDGTQIGGQANRLTFPLGAHTIDAQITDALGTFGVSASFEVD